MGFCSALAFASSARATTTPSASWLEQVDSQHSLFTAGAVAVATVVLIDGDRVDLGENVRSPNGKARLDTHESHGASRWVTGRKGWDDGVTVQTGAYLSSAEYMRIFGLSGVSRSRNVPRPQIRSFLESPDPA
jgi:hypothetical protein